MAARIAFVFALVTAALVAAPPALAVGEEVYGTIEQTRSVVDQTIANLNSLIPSQEPPPEEPPAEEGTPSDGSHGHGSHDEHASPPPPVAPVEPVRPIAPLAPPSRFVPIPVTIHGPAPRIDLQRIIEAVDAAAQTPLAPAPAPAPGAVAPAAAPAAPSRVAPAEEAAPALEPAALALGVATAASAASPAAAGALWERLRRLGFLALLYSRIAKERILDHTSRDRLLGAIRAKPGQAVADLAEGTGVPRNTVTYHLRVLEREGLVSSTRNGRNRLFFAPGALPQRAVADAQSAAEPRSREQVIAAFGTLRHETTLAMARVIGAEPGVDQKALCARVGVSPSLAHWHADRLVASGVVDKRREGRNVRYYPGASFGLVQAHGA